MTKKERLALFNKQNIVKKLLLDFDLVNNSAGGT